MADSTNEKWVALSLSAALVPLEEIAQGIEKVTTTLGTIIDIHKTVLEIISALTIDFLNVQNLIIQSALAALNSLIEQYVISDAKIHLLTVPIRKNPRYRLEADFDIPSDEDSWAFNDAISPETRKTLQDTVNLVAQYDQGNEGFARTLIEASYDDKDPNRPVYGQNDAIFGAIFMAGGSDLLGAYKLLRLLQGIFNTSLKGNPLVPDTIAKTAQSLTVTPIAAPGTTRIGVRLQWDNPPTLQTLVDFGGARIKLREIAIIRSTNDEIITAQTWGDLFGQTQPSVLGDDEPIRENAQTTADNKTSIIRIFKYNGVRNAYVDDDETLERGVNYYYAVAYRYAISSAPDDKGKVDYIDQTFDQLSNVVTVRLAEELPSTRGGVKPDWVATPGVLDLVPDLKFFLRLIQSYVNSMQSQTQGAASAMQSYIKFLIAEAARYADFAAEINNRLAKLKSLLQLPATGLYATFISNDTGGLDYFLKTATQRLSDTADTSAPPFFKHGVTAGIVLVAGAPNPAALAPVQTLISLLFGSPVAETPFEKALNSIDRLVSQAETLEFGDDLQPGHPRTETTPYQTFGDDMQGRAPTAPDVKIPFDT